MVTPDPKWLEILKASGWQTSAIAAGCGIIFALINTGLLPSPGATAMVLIASAGIICGCLAITSILSALFRFIPVNHLIVQWWQHRQIRHSVEKYIPYMTDKEKEIIAWLLKKNQKTFTCDVDGGYANTLISRGIVVPALRSGQTFSTNNMPVVIPDHIWDVLERHKDRFPYTPTDDTHPWRIHWMAR
ncbi:MAG: super-infection exclusion protein B [Nitrospiria bacterium]